MKQDQNTKDVIAVLKASLALVTDDDHVVKDPENCAETRGGKDVGGKFGSALCERFCLIGGPLHVTHKQLKLRSVQNDEALYRRISNVGDCAEMLASNAMRSLYPGETVNTISLRGAKAIRKCYREAIKQAREGGVQL